MASFKTYLNNDLPYRNAFDKWNNAGLARKKAKEILLEAKPTDANFKQLQANLAAAEKAEAAAEREKNLAQSNAKVAYDKIKTDKQIADQKKKDAETQQRIDVTQAQVDKYTNAGLEVPSDLQAKLDKEKAGLSGAPQGPKTTTTSTSTTTTTTATSANTADDLLVLDNLFKPGNEQLLLDVKKNLKKFGYKGPVDTKYSDAFKNAFNSALALRGNAPTNLKGNSLLEFIANPQGIDLGSIGSGGGPTIQAFIADDTKAASLVKEAFKTNLQREATPEEIAKYSKVLQAAQRKNPYKTTNGIRTGGIDETEFLAQQIQKLPEYSTKKQEKLDTTKQSVLKLMRANGLPVNQDQVDNFATAIQNGTTLDTVAKQIRQIAGAGLPDNIKNLLAQGIDLDTVYSPYKSTMASTLELNPNDIQLNDPTLRLALGPDKEMSIYDFQKLLKKDARWQYTNNAKEEISQSVQKVLQDFGFQG